MTFQEAAKKLKEMASGKYSSIEVSANFHADNDRLSVRLYIADIGFTEYQRSYDMAFVEMERLISGTESLPMEAQIPSFEAA